MNASTSLSTTSLGSSLQKTSSFATSDPTHLNEKSLAALRERLSASSSLFRSQASLDQEPIVRIEFLENEKNFYHSEGVVRLAYRVWEETKERPWITAAEMEEIVKKKRPSAEKPGDLFWQLSYWSYRGFDGIRPPAVSFSSLVGSAEIGVETPSWNGRFAKAGATSKKIHNAAMNMLKPDFKPKPDLYRRFEIGDCPEIPLCPLDVLIEN